MEVCRGRPAGFLLSLSLRHHDWDGRICGPRNPTTAFSFRTSPKTANPTIGALIVNLNWSGHMELTLGQDGRFQAEQQTAPPQIP